MCKCIRKKTIKKENSILIILVEIKQNTLGPRDLTKKLHEDYTVGNPNWYRVAFDKQN